MSADLIVGIDVGMSGTGVAYACRGESMVKFLTWRDNQQPKVPTRLAYSIRKQSPELLGWGFDVPDVYLDGVRIEEWFKTDLGRNGVDQKHVERLFTDYLTCLYKCLSNRFVSEKVIKQPWESTTVHFLFSAPATWNPKVVDTFKALASKAGFDNCDGHTITASLIEPEAVAAYELCQEQPKFKVGENVLIVDAGGGTGDFCLLRVEDTLRGQSRAVELQPVIGYEIGSTYIDGGFELLAKSLLEPFASRLGRSIDDVAWELRNTVDFQRAKHGLSHDALADTKISVPHLAGSHIVLCGEELKALFDKQVGLIESRIDDLVGTLVRWTIAHPTTPLDYVLLSGGLGSSQYVGHRLTEFCAKSQLPLLKATKVIVSSMPRLSVCMGIVYHAHSNIEIFPRFPSKASFGIACRIPYSGRPVEQRWNEIQAQARHENRLAVKDEFKKKWFEDCIDWFIKKGDEVPENRTIASRHSAVFHPDDKKRHCIVEIVVTLKDKPSPFKTQDTRHTETYKTMLVDLSRVENHVHVRNDRLYHIVSGKKTYVQVDFIIEAKVGLAEAEIQCYEIDRTRQEPLSAPVRVDMNDLQPQPICQGLAELEG